MMASGLGSEASCSSAPIFFRTSFAGSRFGKTESATATLNAIPLLRQVRNAAADAAAAHGFFHVLHAREDDRTLRTDQDVLFEAGGHLETGMAGERLDGEIHAFFEFGRILQRVGARHPHALVERDADAVRELLQR